MRRCLSALLVLAVWFAWTRVLAAPPELRTIYTPPARPDAYFWGWLAVTGTINTLSHVFTPEDVDGWAEKNPRLAWVLSMVRRAGFEPLALIQAFFAYFRGNPPPPGHAATLGRALPPPRPPAHLEAGAGVPPSPANDTAPRSPAA